jgi:MFS family permease
MATLPIGILVCLATLSILTASQAVKFVSRRCLFITASTLGALGAGLMSYAVSEASFTLFTVSAAPQGIAYGISNLYRFYAADTSLPQHREKALAATLGGAVLSAFIGPELSRYVHVSASHNLHACACGHLHKPEPAALRQCGYFDACGNIEASSEGETLLRNRACTYCAGM